MKGARWLGLTLAFGAMLAAGRGEAAVPVRFEYDDGITRAMRDAVQRHLTIELRATLVERPADEQTTVRITSLASSSHVRIEIDDAVTGKSLARTVDLLAMGPGGSARLLAVAVVELLAASWAELTQNPRPAAEPVGPRAPVELQRDALDVLREREPNVLDLTLVSVLSGPYGDLGAVPGGGARLVIALTPHLVLPLELTLQHGQQTFPLGKVAADLASACASVGLTSRVGVFDLRGALGLRGGWARFVGAPVSPNARGSSMLTPWLTPVASAAVSLASLRPFVLELSLEAGYAQTRASARVERTRELAVTGPWAGVSLAVGWALGDLR